MRLWVTFALVRAQSEKPLLPQEKDSSGSFWKVSFANPLPGMEEAGVQTWAVIDKLGSFPVCTLGRAEDMKDVRFYLGFPASSPAPGVGGREVV